jgi:hypothetical protein
VGGAATPLPDMVFTLLGTLTGNVKAGTTNAPNATVNVPGTELFALTDSGGNFVLRNVPTGMRTVQARLNAATATQNVTVVKGDNTPLAFALQTALTGTVEGSVGFHGMTLDTGITVSAAGTTWSTTVAPNGDFRLNLPPGAWEIVADARLYPRNRLGMVFVSPGATTRLPTAKMSLYQRLPMDFPVSNTTVDSRGVCEGDYVLTQTTGGPTPRLDLVDTNLLNRRLLGAGGLSFSTPIISSKCRWVAFQIGSTNVVLHNVTTGEQRFLPGNASVIEFSTDETVLFYRVGNTLHRYTIASGVDDSFAANAFVMVSRDRYLVAGAGAPSNYQLVTPTALTSAFSTAFTAVAHGGAAYGLTDCTVVLPVTCTLRVLGTTGSTVFTYATGSVPQTVGFESGNSTGEYYHFRTSATASILVRTSTGTGINMPVSTQQIRYNPSGTRMAYLAPAAAQALREEALPGTGSVAPVATSTATFQGDWSYVSDTRLIAFDMNATPRRIDVKSGTAVIDTDVTATASGLAMIRGAVATWGRSSTTKRMALLADGADVLIDAPPSPVSSAASAAPGVDPAAYVVPKYGAVSTDLNTTFFIDAQKNEVRKVLGLVVQGSFGGNTFLGVRFATFDVGYQVPAYDQFLQLIEPGVQVDVTAIQPTVALLMLARDANAPRELLVHRLANQP